LVTRLLKRATPRESFISVRYPASNSTFTASRQLVSLEVARGRP
jgi:hypothetical protein